MSKEEEVLDRGDEFDPDQLEEEDEFESSVEDEEDDELDGEDEDEDDDVDDEEDEDDIDEDEDEDDEDLGDDDSSDDSEDGEKDKGRIPRSRLNEVIAQRDAERAERERALERADRLEAMVEKLISSNATGKDEDVEKAPKYDFDAAEEKYIDLILEGEVKEALQLRKEINQAKEDEFKNTIESVRTSTTDSVLSESKFDAAVEAMEAKYPFLNYDSDDYNEEAVESVNALMSGYMSSGISKVEALNKAVKQMAPIYEKEPEADKEKLGGKPKRKPTPKNDRKRNAKAAKAQPSKSPGRKAGTEDLDTIQVSKLSDRDFSKLTDREKRILRGD